MEMMSRHWSAIVNPRPEVTWPLLLMALLSAFLPALSDAAPQGGEVTGGSGNIQLPDSQTTVINQQSQVMSIQWDSFNVGADEQVQFNQPGRNAVSLNHILDQNPSQIFGRIDANGRVFLMNPNGMVFGESARINVGGLVAGAFTLDMNQFSGNDLPGDIAIDIHNGGVINAGSISGLDGASIALLGNTVRNDGRIEVRYGKIQLLSADQATLSFDSEGLIQFAIDAQTLENLTGASSAILNQGTLQADNGYVVMAAAAASNVFNNVINNTGLIQANRIVDQAGVVRLEGAGGNVITSGVITATGAEAQAGGTITLLGDRVGVLGTGVLDVSGASGGGSIAVGGYQRGSGDHTAMFTQIAADAALHADAMDEGDGGDITVWADDTTWAFGTFSARGGSQSGDGGFVEISGRQGMVLDVAVDLTAAQGQRGTLLLDPTDIIIHDQADGVQGNDGALPDLTNGTVGAGAFDIGELALEALAASADLELEATNNITINNLADNNLNLAINTTGSILITADSDGNGSGSFSMNSGDTITTQGSLVSIAGASVTVGNITTNAATDGTISISSTGSVVIGNLNAGTAGITVTADSNGNGTESLTVNGTLTGGTVALSGGNDGSDTLIGPNSANTWNITGLNAGTLNGASFSNFPFLDGNANDDAFVVTGIGNITGQIDGGAQVTGDSIDYSGASGIIAVTINDDFTNIETLTGGGADNTLIAENIANTWTITGANSGTVAGIAFNDFHNLTGGTGVDDFVLSGGSVSGTISGQGGTDSLSANNTANNWNILSANGGNVDSVFAFTSIENLTGGAGVDMFFVNGGSVSGAVDGGNGTDTLSPANVVNTWNITGADQGNVTGIGSFTSIENLTGRNNTDTFIFSDGATISGSVNGGAGTDTVNQSAQSGAVLINIASGAYTNMEFFIGNNNSQLIADNVTNTWTLTNAYDGVNDGTLGTTTFQNFNNLTGGTNTDSFILSGGTLTGIIDGGGGTDTLTGDNVANTWSISGADAGDVTGIGSFTSIENLTGNASTDDFIFADAGSISGVINGAGSTDSVDLSAETGAVVVTIGATGFLNIEAFTGNNADSTLIGSNVANSWSITGANSGTINTTTFSGFNDLTGGTNIDTFTLSGGSISGEIAGGAGNDTLTGGNLANTWNISGADTGSVDNVSLFSSIENLTGNANTDAFVFADGGSISGTINGAAGSDTLNYAAETGAVAVDLSGSGFSNIENYVGNNTNSSITGTNTTTTWTVTGVNDGTINAINFTSFNTLIGSDSADTFVVNGGSITGTINGGLGSDTLTGDNAGQTWNITGVNTGNTSSIAGFSGIETLQGGTGVDAFVFANGASYSGTINGGTGTDNVDHSAQLGAVTVDLITGQYVAVESFIGNATNSTFIAGNAANVWVISGADSGTVNGIGFADFNNLTGNATTDQFTLSGGSISGDIDGAGGADTLIADNTTNTWTITGADTGSATGVGGFANMENLTGGTLDDTFVIASGGSISAIVNGNTGSDTADFSANAGAVSILLGVSNYTNIELYIGNNTNSSLTGPAGNNTWTVTGNNDGSVGAISFINFNNITGNVSADNYSFQTGGLITGLVDGSGGVDVADFSADAGIVSVALDGADFANIESYVGNNTNSTLIGSNAANTWTVTGANDGSVGSITFSNFNNLTGNADTDAFVLSGGTVSGSIDGAAGNDTLTADNLANTWVITTADTGNVTGVAAFTNIENLAGNSATDGFSFNDGSSISGTVNGGAGVDSVNQSAQSGLVNITLGASGYSNIESYVGNGTNSTLTGDNVNNSWLITGANAGTVGTVSFSAFSNLTGGTANDSYVLSGGSLSGTINGGAGADQLQAGNTANTWNMTGADIGNVTGINAFANIETLLGNASTDNFVFANGSSFSGVINGSTGSDTVDMSSQVGAVTVQLGAGSYVSIEQFIGNSTNSTLVGGNIINAWSITATDAGSVNGINFTDFNNLTGNANADTFTLLGGDITGVVDGGSGNDTIAGDNLNTTWNVTAADSGSLTGIANFQNIDSLTGNNSIDTFIIGDDLSGNISGGAGNDSILLNNLVSIGGAINGGTGTDSLTGPNVASAWIISAADAGTVNGNSFSAIENLNGGSANDTFNITNAAAATASGTIDGGAGDDTFSVDYTAASSRTLSFAGGVGTDVLELTGGAANLSNNYTYGPGPDQVSIVATTGAQSQTVAAAAIESVEDSMTAQTISLSGSSGADSMTLSPGAMGGTNPISFQISGFMPTEFSNKTDISISGAAGGDSLQIDGTVTVSGDITISVETVLQGAGGLLSADNLTFNQATAIGTAGTSLETDVNNLVINGPTTNAYLLEADDVSLTAGTITGVLELESTAGDITSSGTITVTGSAEFIVSNGHDILLDDSNNLFSGTPTFSSAGTINDITLVDNSAVDLQGLNISGNLTVTADGAITQNSALLIQGNSVFDAGTSAITLNNAANNFVGTVSLNNSGANAVSILDMNALQFAASSLGSGAFTANAQSILQSGAIVQQPNAGAVTITAQTGPIVLTNAGNDFTGIVSLMNLGATNASITDSNQLLLGSSSTNGGDLTVTAGNGVILSGTTVSNTGDITITATAGDIQLGRLDAGTGTITLNAISGSILGDNSQITDPNLTAQDLVMLAGSTIGDFNNPIAIDISGTSFFFAGDGSANIIGETGTVLPGSILVNNVSFTALAIGQGQSVSFIVATEDEEDIIGELPLYTTVDGGVQLPKKF